MLAHKLNEIIKIKMKRCMGLHYSRSSTTAQIARYAVADQYDEYINRQSLSFITFLLNIYSVADF